MAPTRAATSRCIRTEGYTPHQRRGDGLDREFAARRSEIVMLEWAWVDLENRRVVWPDSKTGGMSKPMSEEAYQLLATAPRQEGNPYVLPSPRHSGRHLTTGEYYGGWSRALKGAGATHVGTHGIRHRSATDIANLGIPVKVGMMLTARPPTRRRRCSCATSIPRMRQCVPRPSWWRIVSVWARHLELSAVSLDHHVHDERDGEGPLQVGDPTR